MPAPIKVRGTATRSELLKVLKRWDDLGRLFICRGSEVNADDRCELFAVAKDADKDRQILHRKRRNLREKHIAGASRDLPHGVQLCQLPLEGRFVCACSVDDVKDFYHAYSATEARARSSPVGPLFRSSEVRHLKAFRDAEAQGRISKGDEVACCFQGLGMGDHAAVDIAQESHVNLLRAFGAMRANEVLRYRDPVPYPESGFVEGVMIDDHLGLQLLKRLPSMKRTLEQPARDQEVFASSASAYDYANLIPHPKKKQRRSLHVKAWGAELEGGRGLVGPARGRLLALSRLSAMSAKPGPMDQQILDGPRIPVPPWFWKLRRGDQAGALELDELQGPQLPRERDQLVRGRVTALTHKIRTNLLKDLTIWLQPRVPQYSLDELARTHIDVLCEWLEEFMIIMFLEHKSRRAASETLNALVQQYGWLRSSLAGPWNLIRTWEQLEPVQHHPPMPLMVVYALATTALLWRWPRMADLVLPGDHFDDEVLYVRIGQPKTRHRAAASQHVRVDHPGVAAWIVDALPSTPGWRRIWNGSWAAFKLRFDALQSEVLEGTPFLPSSLRPGGATFLFRSWDENLTRLQWRGRWKSFRMLETYVQELGATEVTVGTLLCLQCLAWEPKLGLSDRRGLDRSLYSFC
ncbi:BUB3.2 [Symbiodinium sp. CCMP2592]|nr:BUB3.2 [Symbiodinium sp. CCMP2592]